MSGLAAISAGEEQHVQAAAVHRADLVHTLLPGRGGRLRVRVRGRDRVRVREKTSKQVTLTL